MGPEPLVITTFKPTSRPNEPAIDATLQELFTDRLIVDADTSPELRELLCSLLLLRRAVKRTTGCCIEADLPHNSTVFNSRILSFQHQNALHPSSSVTKPTMTYKYLLSTEVGNQKQLIC